MNMQYAQAVLAHEMPHRPRLALTPIVTAINPAAPAEYPATAPIPRDLVCQ
ncbi:hypothetical protein [uncultured Mycolicibacterium sp.]|uniref:hypothetical protein n=1 Tax=uncultured Mycolicibacterium sp. TaxID=2320817 RepID=UPI002627EDF9|nr:hypothetical protein [uncultured Mycolicibacterium sp.]